MRTLRRCRPGSKIAIVAATMLGYPYAAGAPAGCASPPAWSARSISAGAFVTCASHVDDGRVECWGRDYPNGPGPEQVPDAVNGTMGTAEALVAGRAATCAIQTGTRAAVCWGGSGGVLDPPESVDGTLRGASAISMSEHGLAIEAPEAGPLASAATGIAALLAASLRRSLRRARPASS